MYFRYLCILMDNLYYSILSPNNFKNILIIMKIPTGTINANIRPDIFNKNKLLTPYNENLEFL